MLIPLKNRHCGLDPQSRVDKEIAGQARNDKVFFEEQQ